MTRGVIDSQPFSSEKQKRSCPAERQRLSSGEEGCLLSLDFWAFYLGGD